MTAPLQQDVVWKMQELTPMRPKKDGSAEVYLRQMGMTHERFVCNTLVVVKTDGCNKCSVCKQKEKTTKLCRINQNGSFSDIPICTDCINVFVKYNPNAVFDLEIKKPN